MNFAEAAKNETKFTTTENGALALNTTSNALLDFYSVVGALRKADDNRIFRLFEENIRYMRLRLCSTQEISAVVLEKDLYSESFLSTAQITTRKQSKTTSH